MNPEMAPAGYVSDECIQVPRCTADNYVELLLQICKEKSIGLIIPTIDTELLILAINRLKFEAKHWAIFGSTRYSHTGRGG